MHNSSRTSSPLWQYVFFAVVASLLLYTHTPLGTALSMDSLFYLSTAVNILDGDGIAYTTYALNGPEVQPTTLWPPLYPILLAGVLWLAGLVGVSDVVAIVVVNFVAFLTSLYLMLRIASLPGWSWAGFVITCVLAASPSLQLIFMYAWSEAVFIPLSLAGYLCLHQYLTRADTAQRSALYSMVFLLALATYTRYVGIAFFAAAALAVIIFDRGDIVKRVRTAALAALAYLAIITPMLIRNFLVADALSGGDRGTLDTNLATDLGLLFWYLYLEFVNLPVLAGVVILILSIAFAVWLVSRRANIERAEVQAIESINIVVPFLFAATYFALLLISRMTQVTDLDSRMLGVAVPFLLIGLLGIYQLLAARVSSGLAALPFVLPLFVFALNAVSTHSSILKGWRDQGEPGAVLGLVYPSMSGQRMDSLRRIGAHFRPNPGDILLTDIKQPVIAGYIFPELDVRKIPGEPNKENLSAVVAAMQRTGLAVISKPNWGQALTEELEDRASLYRIESAAGGLEYIVITLPVESQ